MPSLSDFHELVHRRFEDLTRAEKRIATYLLHNFDEAALMPAAEVGRVLGIHEATVVRCARSLGFAGYPELRQFLVGLIRSQPAFPAATDGAGALLDAVVTSEIRFLQEAASAVDEAKLNRAIDLVNEARRIYLFGLGYSASLVQYAAFQFRRLGLDTVLLTRGGRDLYDGIMPLRRDDVLLAVRFRNPQQSLLNALDRARRVGAPSILITDVLASVLPEPPTVVLAARRNSLGPFNSLVVPLTVLNALMVGVAERHPERTQAARETLAELRRSYLPAAGLLEWGDERSDL